MTTPTPERDSGWISGGVVDTEDARLATGVFAAPGAGPVQARSGIKPAGGNPGQVLPTATVSGKVTVNPFQAVIQGTRATAAGAYLVTMDRPKTIDVLGARPASTENPRHDLVVVRQYDTQYGDKQTGMVVELVPGDAAAQPVDPQVPGDHIRLAKIVVPKNATTITAADIIDERPYTAAAGGVVRVWNDRPANPHIGMYVHHVQTHRLEVYTGGDNWRTVYEDTGWVDLTLSANWEVWGGETPAVRRIGSTVHLRGSIRRVNTSATNGAQALLVPVGFRPAIPHRWFTPNASGKPGPGVELSLQPSGAVLHYHQVTEYAAGNVTLLSGTWVIG